MIRFPCLALVLSVALAVEFTSVYEWKELDYDWPSEEIKREAVAKGYQSKENVPRHMAVFGERIFLSVTSSDLASLVWLPTNATSPPKMVPLLPWQDVKNTSCAGIQKIGGLKVDSNGRLWAVDDGSTHECPPKLWIFDLSTDSVVLEHQFPNQVVSHGARSLRDLELDESNRDWLAYILDIKSAALVVYSLGKNESWRVETGKYLVSIAISPFKGHSRQLYVTEYLNSGIYSISVAELRAGSRNVTLNLFGSWTSKDCYRMTTDRNGHLYSACFNNSAILRFDTRNGLEERLYDGAKTVPHRPLSFSLDAHGNFWLMVTVAVGNVNLGQMKLLQAPSSSFAPTKTQTKRAIDPAPKPRNVTAVFEWDDVDFWSSSESRENALRDKSFLPDVVQPHYIAVSENKVYISFSRYDGVPVTLAWLPKKNAFSPTPKLPPYPSWQMQKHGECGALQDIRGLQVDSLGRLWAVDNGFTDTCPPKLWIFNPADSIESAHEFPREIVPLDVKRWLTDLVVDEQAPDDHFAYIADSTDISTRLLVFSLKQRKSWRVETNVKQIESLALSPAGKTLYVGGIVRNELHRVRVSDLRNGFKDPAVSFAGKKTAPTRRMAVDRNGRLYFDLVLKKSIGTWDTNNAAFHEENLFTDSNVEDYWPYIFAFDASNVLWLMTTFTLKPKYKLYKAQVNVITNSQFIVGNERAADPCGSLANVCENGGVCVSLTDQDEGFRCECSKEFHGPRCEFETKVVTTAPEISSSETTSIKNIEKTVYYDILSDLER